MKALKYIVIALVAGLFASCQDDVDNNYSKYKTTIEISTSTSKLILNESMPDEEALTVSWNPAYDFGEETVVNYKYEIYMLGSSATAIVEYEDDFIFERLYTHQELQDMLVDYFKQTTSTNGELRFRVTATFENPNKLILPDMAEKTIKVKTYGAKQFAADEVYMGGTALTAPVQLSATADDADIYFWDGRLEAGTLNFPVTYGDEDNVIVPEGNANTDFIGGDAMPAIVMGSDETSAGWNIPIAYRYRVTLNFKTQTVTIMEVSKEFKADNVYMAGTAVGGTPIELTASAKDENIYVWTGDLEPGKINFPVIYGAENNLIVPASNTDTAANSTAQNAVMKDVSETSAAWTVATADTYRVTVNFNTQTVTIIDVASIFEFEKILLAGTATDGIDNDKIEITQTLENENVYAWHAALKAGTLWLPLEMDGTTAKAIVPADAANHTIDDGNAVAFGQTTSANTTTQYWTIPADGTYRIIVNVKTKTIKIHTPDTDPQSWVTPEWKDTRVTPTDEHYTQVVDALWMWGCFNGFANNSNNQPEEQYKLIQSLANPYVFVYYSATPLPRSISSGNWQYGAVKFMAANFLNNVYAFGSTDTTATSASPKFNTGVTLNTPETIVGGQANNRYSYFIIPVGCNYVEVDIQNLTVVFKQK